MACQVVRAGAGGLGVTLRGVRGFDSLHRQWWMYVEQRQHQRQYTRQSCQARVDPLGVWNRKRVRCVSLVWEKDADPMGSRPMACMWETWREVCERKHRPILQKVQ